MSCFSRITCLHWHYVLLFRNDYLQERVRLNDKYRNNVKVVSMWEDSTEVKFEQLPSIARDLHMLENQLEQMQPLNREVINFKPRIDETFELGKSLDALIQSAETVVTNRRRSTQVASGNVARTERRVVEIQQTFQVSEGKQNRD